MANLLVAVLFGSLPHIGTSLAVSSEIRQEVGQEVSSVLSHLQEYSTNAICSKSRCINPIFPGMEDLHRLQQAKWVASSLQKTQGHMNFCRNAVTYDPALPVPEGASSTVKEMVARQDDAASTMFYYHLHGLGLEAWDYQKPEFADDCIKSTWRMVCYTYFPRAEMGVQDGAWSTYIRPCQSTCQNYVKSCGVECCDESVQCVFTHSKPIGLDSKGAVQTVTTEGYLPHDGPSSLCTGGARRSATPWSAGVLALLGIVFLDGTSVASVIRYILGRQRRLFGVAALLVIAVSLQGCDYDVPVHTVGNWRAQPDYLLTHEFIPPGGSAEQASLNSCSQARLSQTLQCSGRGVCKLWQDSGVNTNNRLAFCLCDRDWADPECRSKRKSQAVAYGLAMFFGWMGADQFYLGYPALGIMKLFTFGGFGGAWIADIIRIGSAPVYASDYMVAADLPHFVYVLTATMYACLIGFAFTYVNTIVQRSRKRKDAMLLGLEEEARQGDAIKPFASAYGKSGTNPVIKRSAMDVNGPMGMPGMGGPGGMPGMGGPGYGTMGGMGPMGPMGSMGPGPMGPMPGSMGPMGPMGPMGM